MNVAVICRGFLALVLTGIFCAQAHASGEVNPPPDIPVESWLRASDRRDFPWKIVLGKPSLTFQQRRYVQARITFRVRDLLKADVSLLDLHLIVKLASEDGRWFPGQSYSHFEPPPGLAAADQIHSLSNLYVRQGTYTIAIMVYDSAHKRGNLWRGKLRVPPLKKDPLPDIDRSLPEAEFLSAAEPLRIGRGDGLDSMITFDPWALGQGELLLPVANKRPVQVDIVANVSLSVATDGRRSEAPNWMYQWNGGNLLQIINVLSQLNLQGGCVRVSALDLRRQKIFVDRQDVSSLDWSNLRQAISGMDRIRIEANTLAVEKYQPAFLAHYLEQVSSRPSSCEVGGQSPLHVLIMVSNAFIFPLGTEMKTAPAEVSADVFYHLRVVPVAGADWDEIGRVVKPLRPVRFDFSDSGHFRKTLAQLIAGIETASQKVDAKGP